MSAIKALNIYKAIDFQLRIEEGPDKGRAFRIRPPQIVVGRDPQSQIQVNDPRASRQQFTITFGEHIVLVDNSSRKTTRVNDQPFTKHNLVPGDFISFGDTRIRFVAQSKAQLPATQKAAGPAAVSGKRQPAANQPPRAMAGLSAMPNKKIFNPFYIMVATIAVLIAILLLLPDTPGGQAEEITSATEINRQIESSQEYQTLLRENHANKLKTTSQEYQVAVEQHFIRGFRDFQTGNFSRAAESFAAAVAKDPGYERARRYAKMAEQKVEQQIERHMYDGEQYKSKRMYPRCAAEFEKAMVLINKPDHSKYQLAKETRNECRILQIGGL